MSEPKIVECAIKNVEFGEGVTVVKPVNMYDCKIGDGTFIGPFVEIQRGVTVGRHCRIQSHAFICELVTIGDNCFISHGAKFINDPFRIGGPARGRSEYWETTHVGHFVTIGTNATVMPVKIADFVLVGAGAVVTKDLTEPGVYAGNPARLLRKLTPEQIEARRAFEQKKFGGA